MTYKTAGNRALGGGGWGGKSSNVSLEWVAGNTS